MHANTNWGLVLTDGVPGTLSSKFEKKSREGIRGGHTLLSQDPGAVQYRCRAPMLVELLLYE